MSPVSASSIMYPMRVLNTWGNDKCIVKHNLRLDATITNTRKQEISSSAQYLRRCPPTALDVQGKKASLQRPQDRAGLTISTTLNLNYARLRYIRSRRHTNVNISEKHLTSMSRKNITYGRLRCLSTTYIFFPGRCQSGHRTSYLSTMTRKK